MNFDLRDEKGIIAKSNRNESTCNTVTDLLTGNDLHAAGIHSQLYIRKRHDKHL